MMKIPYPKVVFCSVVFVHPFQKMDTLSGSVSTLKIRPNHHLKNHVHILLPQQQSHFIVSSTTTTRPNKLSNNKVTSSSSTVFATPPIVTSTSSSSSRAPSPLKKSLPESTHRNPSTGYAVALLDAARRWNVLEAVQRDAKRLSKWLSDEKLISPFVVGKKGEIILREMMEKGKFEKLLRKMVNLLVDGNKAGMVKEVVMEFGRIYGELLIINNGNDQLVVVESAGLKMEANQVVEIAQRVHRMDYWGWERQAQATSFFNND